MHQYPRENLDAYVKLFHVRALNYYDLVIEDVLLDACLRGTIEDYRIYLENLSPSPFSRLMEAVRRTNASIKTTIKSSATISSMPSKRTETVTVEKSKGAKGSN